MKKINLIAFLLIVASLFTVIRIANAQQASFIILTGGGNKYIKPVGSLWGLQWPGLATSTTGCLSVNSSGWISPSGSACGSGSGSSFSTTSANYWASLGLAFSTTSSNYWSSAGLGFSTTSQEYWNSQFRDWKIQSGALTPTTTVGIIVNASSTINRFDSFAGTTSAATSTSFYVSGQTRLASLSGILKATTGVVSAAANGTDYTLITAVTCTGTDKLSAVTATGSFTCSTDATGGGSGFPFSADTNYGQVVYSTSTPTLWLKSGIFASSTSHFVNYDATNGTTTNSTSTNLKVSGQLNWGSGTGLTLTTSGVFSNYAGTSCTNQFVRSLDASGAATCATVANTDLANSSINVTYTGMVSGSASVSLGGTLAITSPAWPWSTATTYSTTTHSTTTPLWLKTALYASSTLGFPSILDNAIFINSTSTNATTTNQYISGQLRLASLTGLLYGSTGVTSAISNGVLGTNGVLGISAGVPAFVATSTLYGAGSTGGYTLQWSNTANGLVLAATSTCIQITGSAALCDGNDATGGTGVQVPTYIVAASGGDFTTIQGALNACTAGANIYLTDTSYSQGGTGLVFKGSNCHLFGRGAGTTTISFTGATTGFKTNSAAATYARNSINNVTLTGDGTTGSIAIDASDMVRNLYDNVIMDNWDTGIRLNDTQNITFYNTFRKITATTIKRFGINASSTNPVNDNWFYDLFLACDGTTDCVGLNLNNGQANSFTNLTVETGTNTNTTGIQIRANALATNNGTFSNSFHNVYVEGNHVGVSASSTVGSASVFGNNFYGGQIETNVTDYQCESADCFEMAFHGTGINFADTNIFSRFVVKAKNHGTMLQVDDQGFSDLALSVRNNNNFAHNSLDLVKFSLLNGTDSSNLLNLSNLGTGATIIATSTRGTDMVLTGGGFFGIGTTTPWAKFSVNPSNIGTGPAFAVGSSTASSFVITNIGRIGIASSTPSPLWGMSISTTTVWMNAQIAGAISSSTSQAATYTVNWETGNTQRFILNQATSFVINATSSNPRDGGVYSLVVCQDGTGSRAVTWVTPGQLVWAGGNGATTTVASAASSVTRLLMQYDARVLRYTVLASTTKSDPRACVP